MKCEHEWENGDVYAPIDGCPYCRIKALETALYAMPCTCQHPALECERCRIVRVALEQKDGTHDG